MGLLNKLGIAIGGQAPRESARPQARKGRSGGNGHTAVVAAGPHREPQMQEITRVSNGLKEFLWNLDGLGRGTLLDLGPAWQTTLNFFIERGFRVTSDDILRDWSEFQSQESASAKERLTPRRIRPTHPGSAREKIPGRKSPVFGSFVRCLVALGFPRLSGSRAREKPGRPLNGNASSRWRSAGAVPQ